jgi:hypothetical protein
MGSVITECLKPEQARHHSCVVVCGESGWFSSFCGEIINLTAARLAAAARATRRSRPPKPFDA